MEMSDYILIERSECPLCTRPINRRSSSSKGNVICTSCFPSLESLPTKNNVVVSKQKRSHTSENSDQINESEVNESTSNPSCPYRRAGCLAILNPEDVEDHKLDCQFSCMNFCSLLGILKCEDETPSADLLDHLADKHMVDCLGASSGTVVRVNQTGCLLSTTHDRIGNLYWNPICILYDNMKFFLETKLLNEVFISWRILVLGSNEVAGRYSATIKVASQRGKSLEWKGQVIPIGDQENSSICFKLPIIQLKDLSSSSNQNDESSEWYLRIKLENKSTEYPSASKNIPSVTCPARPIIKKSDRTENNEGIPYHPGFLCDGCSISPIVGTRFKCMECDIYDLCQKCIDVDTNPHADNIYLRIPKCDDLTWKFNSFTVPFDYAEHVNFDMDSAAEETEDDDESDDES